jgi:hypothetical protein
MAVREALRTLRGVLIPMSLATARAYDESQQAGVRKTAIRTERVGIKVVGRKSYRHMAITPSMEKVMKVNVWDHVQMHVRRVALAAIASGVVGCTAHSSPSAALAELPPAGPSALALNTCGTPLPDARTDGSMLPFDDANRVVPLANFDLSDPAPRDAAKSDDLVAPIGTLAEFVRSRPRGSRYAISSLPWVRALDPLTLQIEPSRESPDRPTDLPLKYYLDHAFDLTEAHEQSMKAQTVSASRLAVEALYMIRPLPVESISAMTVIEPD